jgi:molecular chaperone DnaJ
MNVKEAYSILEISSDSTPEEAKKQYRKLAKQYHPDNKETGVEDKFKKINEAYQVVSSGKSTDREEMSAYHSGPFGRQHPVQAENIPVPITISFTESVTGCHKDIKYKRRNKCKECEGAGQISLNNGCDQCGGKGQVVKRQGPMIFVQTCNKCRGITSKTLCKTCTGAGILDVESSANVTIQGGVINGNILRLNGMGHYVGSIMTMEQHTDVHLYITVIPEPGLSIQGVNVVFTLELTLLEALTGCRKIVKTINGFQDVEVKPQSRNKEEIIIPRLGVNRVGDQRVVLDVKYPQDINNILAALHQSDNYKVN